MTSQNGVVSPQVHTHTHTRARVHTDTLGLCELYFPSEIQTRASIALFVLPFSPTEETHTQSLP